MTLRSKFYAILMLGLSVGSTLFAPPASSPKGQGCGLGLIVPHSTEKTATFYREADLFHPDFHISGILSPDGTLKISTYRELSNGDRSTIDAGRAVRAMLGHFGNKVKRVEVKLSQLENIDDIHVSREPLLDDFNKGWVEASLDPKLLDLQRMVGERADVPGQVLKRAALGTSVGTTVLFSRNDLSRVQMKSSMGREGKWVAVELTFEAP